MKLLAQVVARLVDFSTETSAQNVERNARIATLEAQVAALEATQIKSVQFADDERTIRLCAANGDPVAGGVLPIVIDRGVYQEGKQYAKGDLVSRRGAMWICQAPTSAVPGGPDAASRAWRLSEKNVTAVKAEAP